MGELVRHDLPREERAPLLASEATIAQELMGRSNSMASWPPGSSATLTTPLPRRNDPSALTTAQSFVAASPAGPGSPFAPAGPAIPDSPFGPAMPAGPAAAANWPAWKSLTSSDPF